VQLLFGLKVEQKVSDFFAAFSFATSMLFAVQQLFGVWN
jgi:hypothetical protein